MDALESTLRGQAEPLTYLAFFGALAVFAGLETVLARRRDGLDRRRRWPVNAVLTVLSIGVLGAIPLTALAVADRAAAAGWGLLNLAAVPALAAFAIGIALRSLVAYATHVAMHKVPLLWRVHRVHHTDTAMDVTTTVRFHPLEFVLTVPVGLAAVALFGIPPVAVIVYELLDAAMAVFTHANLRLPRRLDRALQWLLVTPDMHRIHHSRRQSETDSNYGATLSWWDRLFGTYRAKEDAALAALELGLDGEQGRRATSLVRQLALPFAAARPAATAER